MSTPPTLTQAQLTEWRAYHDITVLFRERWPSDTAPLTEVVAAIAAAEKWDSWHWLLDHHLDLTAYQIEFKRIEQSARAKYVCIRESAWIECRRKPRTMVGQVLHITPQSQADYDSIVHSAWNELQRIKQAALRDAAQQFLKQEVRP